MNSITYQKYRDELQGLLAKGVAELTRDKEEKSVQELQKTATTLERVKNKLNEDQFTIALVADFQGGKSTTFNTLCDGRLLSPRGFGIKTSGCQIVAQNHNGAEEYALIWWRTSQEIIAGFGDLLTPYFNRLDSQRFLGDDMALDTKLDLDKNADRQLVRQAAMQALADHRNNRRTFSDELLDVARCAAVSAEFYASPHLSALRGRATRTESGRLVTQLNPNEIRDFVRFPVDWAERWEDSDPSRFRAEEIVFLFIAKVHLFLHSPALAGTGVCVLDCPGLFASKWDTQVAMDAMLSADAILYLFSGQTAIGATQLKEGLQKIRAMRMEEKLFYGWNMRGKTLAQSEKLARSSRATMRTSGFETSDARFFLFHARLALSSLLGTRLRDGGLRLEEKVILLKEEADQEVTRPRDEEVSSVLNASIKDDYKALKGLLKEPEWTPQLIEEARELSGLPQMLTAIKDFVIQNKAKLILLDNGSSVVERALEQLNGDLSNRERIAKQQEAEFARECEQVKTALQKFQEQGSWVLKDLEHAQPDTRLAVDFVSRLDQTWRSQLADRVAKRIFDEIIEADGVLRNLYKVLFQRDELVNAVVRIFQSEFENAIGNEIAAWVQQLQDSNNPIYNLEVADRVERIQTEMLRLWHETVKENDLAVLRNIPLPHLAGNVWQAQRQLPVIDSASTQEDVQSIIKRVNLELFGQVWGIKTLIVAIVATIFFHGPPGWLVAAAALLVVIVAMKLGPNQIIQRLADKIREDMERNWVDSEKLIRTGMESFGQGIRQWYRQTIESAIISKPKAVVDQRQAKAEEGFKLSQAERDRVAAYAKERRQSDIEPLRAEIVSFTQRCALALKANP